MGCSSQLTREFSREREKIRKIADFQANFFLTVLSTTGTPDIELRSVRKLSTRAFQRF